MAFGTSLGFFIGMMPLLGIRMPIIIAFSIIFNLNIIALILGTGLTMFYPILHIFSFWIGNFIAGYDIPFFSLKFLSFSHLKQWSLSSKYHLIGSVISGLLLSCIIYPILKWFYGRIFNGLDEVTLHNKNFIFHDISGQRWKFLKRSGIIFILITIVSVSIFGLSIGVNPFLRGIAFKHMKIHSNITPIFDKFNENSISSKLKKQDKFKTSFQLEFQKHKRIKKHSNNESKKIFGFYVSWDESSKVSLNSNINRINILVTDWFHLNKDLGIKSTPDTSVDLLAKGHNVKVTPLINNYIDGKWDSDVLHRLISDNKARNLFIENIFNEVKKQKYNGINVDFENVLETDKQKYIEFLSALYGKFHSNGLQVSIDVPASDAAYDYNKLEASADYVIVMAYDEHYQTGQAGPIASNKWFESVVKNMEISDDKLIVGLGAYGLDWIEGSKEPANVMTYGDTMEMATQYKLKINWDEGNGNPYLRYKDGGENHIIWLLDGVTLYNQMKISYEAGAQGVAIWRMGSEDPTVWNVLKDSSNLDKHVDSLKVLKNPVPIHYSGEGEVLRIVSNSKDGKRDISLDKNGFIINENYAEYPVAFEAYRYGKPKGKEVVLTFDDGPDPQYTPRILDILKKNNVKASFFVVGENAEVNPDIIERIYKEGHEIGNHTFTHPNIAEVSELTTKMELNATQRLVEELTGHSMVMFRPPYVADAEPSTQEEIVPILRAQKEGYTMIGELIDPRDWESPKPDVIVKRIGEQLHLGNVILLHDAGGHRENTIKALPNIIKELKNKGYKFVTIGELLGKNRDAIMPVVTPNENVFMFYDKQVFGGIVAFKYVISVLFTVAIILGIFRFIFLIYFSWKQKKDHTSLPIDETYKPTVSVVIAAYNEEKVICKTISSILQSDYSNFEIIVVDDGSKDDTSKIVRETFKDNNRVKVITKKNGGKSSAVNVGFKESNSEIVVALDADTLIDKNAIPLMVRHFKDKKVAAVSGNCKVGNVHNLLTTWQHVEYITGFNLERRAFAYLNCITVVPGAIGAWRREAVKAAGYYEEDTLAEDTDITLKLLKNGYRIAYEEMAYAYTESPEDVKSLIKQRYRWSYGTLQCLWKHKDAVFSLKQKALGFIALPNMWLFQYILQSISPLTDIYFIIGIASKDYKKVLIYYISFFIIDFLASLYAFRLEKENPKPLIWLFLQRIIYRQFMTYVVIKSIFSAFKGITVGWNKLQRKGNVVMAENDIASESLSNSKQPK